jgi:hypothetical protein
VLAIADGGERDHRHVKGVEERAVLEVTVAKGAGEDEEGWHQQDQEVDAGQGDGEAAEQAATAGAGQPPEVIAGLVNHRSPSRAAVAPARR